LSPKGHFDRKPIATTSQHLIHCRDAVAGLHVSVRSAIRPFASYRNSVASKNSEWIPRLSVIRPLIVFQIPALLIYPDVIISHGDRSANTNAFAGESNKRERIREHVPVLKSHTTSAGGEIEENERESTWRTRGNFLSPTRNRVSITPVRSCLQGYHSRPFETTERVRAPCDVSRLTSQNIQYSRSA
jgi:hypothetical protein